MFLAFAILSRSYSVMLNHTRYARGNLVGRRPRIGLREDWPRCRLRLHDRRLPRFVLPGALETAR